MKNLFDKELIAIKPKYIQSRGNCTIIHRVDSSPLVLDKTVKTVINLLGKHYMIDLKALKNKYRPLLGSQNLIPIPLSSRDIFIPFKTRVPMYKNDGAFSYINMKYIKSIKTRDSSTLVILENQLEIKCLSSLATVEKHMKNGKVISRCYEDRSMELRESEALYNSFLPATKADIDMIRRQLEEIVDRSLKKGLKNT